MNNSCLLLAVLCAVLALGFTDAKARGTNRKIERKVYRGQTTRHLQMEGMGMGSVEDVSEDEGMGSGVMGGKDDEESEEEKTDKEDKVDKEDSEDEDEDEAKMDKADKDDKSEDEEDEDDEEKTDKEEKEAKEEKESEDKAEKGEEDKTDKGSEGMASKEKIKGGMEGGKVDKETQVVDDTEGLGMGGMAGGKEKGRGRVRGR